MSRKIKVWRMHPDSCRIERASRNLGGKANPAAVKWCAPYGDANSLGFLLYSPINMDVVLKAPGIFEKRVFSEYSSYDRPFLKSLIRKEDNVTEDRWIPPEGRTKITLGLVEPDVIQIWTGLILQTDPDWSVLIRSPINHKHPNKYYNLGPAYSLQEGCVPTCFLRLDLWLNLTLHQLGKWVSFRKDGPPLAQLVPIHKDALKDWELEDNVVNRNSPEAEEVFSSWLQYNQAKFASGGKQRASHEDETLMKDSTTFFRERKKFLSEQAATNPSAGTGCPYLKAMGSSKPLDEPEIKTIARDTTPVRELDDAAGDISLED